MNLSKHSEAVESFVTTTSSNRREIKRSSKDFLFSRMKKKKPQNLSLACINDFCYQGSATEAGNYTAFSCQQKLWSKCSYVCNHKYVSGLHLMLFVR